MYLQALFSMMIFLPLSSNGPESTFLLRKKHWFSVFFVYLIWPIIVLTLRQKVVPCCSIFDDENLYIKRITEIKYDMFHAYNKHCFWSFSDSSAYVT